MLAWTIYISFAGALAAFLTAPNRPDAARKVALTASLAGLIAAIGGAFTYTGAGAIQTIARVPWIPNLGIQYYLGADGISVVLVLLTAIACLTGVLFSWNISHRANEFFALYLALIGGVYGVFLSMDAFLLFVFYEIAIVPKYFLIAIWGSTRREYGAMKLALYSFFGSALVLVGLIAAFVVAGGKTFALTELSGFAFPPEFQRWAFPLTFVGFAILAGLWPFHTWAPTGHVAAPTAASMLLAGVVMKLGAYGALRVAMALFPAGMREWQEVVGILAGGGIVYAGLVALTQRDFKFVIGYSSVSHMGFVLLGFATMHETGLNGAVLQMFSHGIIAGLLFAVVGRMVYERAHTRELTALEGMNLLRQMPFAAVVFILAALASMGLPGFSGFIAEFQVLIGAWRAFPNLAVLAGIGVVIGVAFTLRAVSQVFLRPDDLGQRPPHAEECEPITVPERVGAAILLACSAAVGLYPRLLLDLIGPTFDAPFFAALRRSGLL